MLLASGQPRGLSGMYPRQQCNAAYALLIEHLQGEAREQFREEVYAPLDAWEQADAVWAQHYPQQPSH
ncbi:MAG: hypothetical protein M3Y33_03825 [Actinomycetota bacterium]|nr:hypothetical protein [Actinomycetota bacterium]